MVTNDLYGKSFQLKFVRPAQMLLFANAVCDPPLGQATVVPYGETVKFTVVLESSRSFPEQPWEAVLWHNGHEGQQWQELHMQEQSEASSILVINSANRAGVYRRYFSATLPNRPSDVDAIQFTLKYRTVKSDRWRWVNDGTSLTDGNLLFQPEVPPSELRDYLKDYSPDISVRSVPSDTPDTQLWSLTTPVVAAEGTESGWANVSLGVPRSFTRWFSLVRIWSPWLAPRHGKDTFNPPQDAVLSSFLRWDGLHLVLLAVSGVDDVLTVFKSDGSGNVIVSARNDRPGINQARVIAAVGKTFETASAAVMYDARKLVNGDEYTSRELRAEMKIAGENDMKPQWMENWYDGLTYCTWNALGQDLHENKIYNALSILADKKINVTNLIIDDNWQSLDTDGENQFQRGWTDFEANKEGFPNGLKHTCLRIRKEHPNIQHIAVWHAIAGYWGGVSAKGSIAQNYKTVELTKETSLIPGDKIRIVDASDIDRMYDDFYKFLLSCGVDSVKTDAQFVLDLLDDAPDRKRFITAFQDAWTIASLRYFNIKAISCMSQLPQILFHTQLPLNKPRQMVRNSDDFFPGIPSSHPWHIFVNAHNSLLTSHLNILPDWDMFQTSHPYSGFHAAGRCVSGGPIYITDEPGEHNIALINAMTARTTDDKTIILRPAVIGKTVGVYTGYEEERLLKVGTFSGSTGCTSILALFNVSPRTLSELVNLASFPGILKNDHYIIRSYTTGEISPSMTLSSLAPIVSVELEEKGYEILSAHRLQSFALPSPSLHTSPTHQPNPNPALIAPIGLLGKMTGPCAITAFSLSPSPSTPTTQTHSLTISTTLKAFGVLGIYISTLHPRSIDDDLLVLIQEKVVPVETVTVDAANMVLSVDVETAWREMGLEAGWGKEVRVVVLMR
ncbi:hypothetical protein MMC21_004199 [Puttea exsequens]|nr:hypothetical protein [Puttea exsequens]